MEHTTSQMTDTEREELAVFLEGVDWDPLVLRLPRKKIHKTNSLCLRVKCIKKTPNSQLVLRIPRNNN